MGKYFLKELEPAKEFSDCHFLGNGRFGASVYGEAGVEKIILNDDTLWSGFEKKIERKDYYHHLLVARKLTLQGKYLEANRYMDENMSGSWSESYMPMAIFNITDGLGHDFRNSISKSMYSLDKNFYTADSAYERVLDLDNALSHVSYIKQGIKYQREAFVSHSYNVLAIKITASKKTMKFAISLKSDLVHSYEIRDNIFCLTGRAPDYVEPEYTVVEPTVIYQTEDKNPTLKFAVCCAVSDTDGEVTNDGFRVYVNNASYATILVTGGTNYEGYRKERKKNAEDVLAKQVMILKNAQELTYEQLKEEHLKDYHSLYHRMTITLGESITDHLPTSERLRLCTKNVQDPSLAALELQYSRYLMISGSRPNSIAMNLQGIWNELVRPAWSCNFTSNINVQMNYWGAEVLNLSECHLPLFDLIENTAVDGRETAEHFYHANGWVANHNLDIWGHTQPACQTNNFAYCVYGGVWLCQHIWTHYEYTKDSTFLRKFYPIIRGAVEFVLSMLVENEEGYLVTAPSTSPENRFIAPGEINYREIVTNVSANNRTAGVKTSCSISVASTMDMTMTRELFGNLHKMANILGIQDDLVNEALIKVKKLMPYKIGRFGQLQEWSEDFEECAPGMGHVSHLYSVYPSNVINEYDDATLFTAAKKSFERRYFHGAFTNDWPAAWGIALAARFGLSNEALSICNSIGSDFGAGLLTRGYKSQIDAILGMGAGIAEMLLQSHCNIIKLLPACPDLWPDGAYSGMKAKGGFEVSVRWKNHKIQKATVKSLLGEDMTITAKGLTGIYDGVKTVSSVNEIVSIPTQKNKCYELIFNLQVDKEVKNEE